MSSFIKIRPVGVELFHADGQTYMTKLIVAFRNFVNAPKKHKLLTRHNINKITNSLCIDGNFCSFFESSKKGHYRYQLCRRGQAQRVPGG
jgi:hypothetical protein